MSLSPLAGIVRAVRPDTPPTPASSSSAPAGNPRGYMRPDLVPFAMCQLSLDRVFVPVLFI